MPFDAPAHGAYHEVAAQLVDVLKSNPDDHPSRLRLARSHLEHEEWGLCIRELDALANAGAPAHRIAPVRGAALLGLGQPAEAIAAIDAYLKAPAAGKFPVDEALGWTIRARCHIALGEHAIAATDFAAALAASPGSPAIHGEYADALVAADRKQDALAALNQALETHRGDPELMERAWTLQADLGQWDAALRTIDAIAASAPAPEPWMAQRARLLVRAGRPDEAKESWDALLDHLLALPSLQRGTPQNFALLTESRLALGQPAPNPAAAAPR